MKAEDVRVPHDVAEKLFEQSVRACKMPVDDLESEIKNTMAHGLYKMTYVRPIEGNYPKDVALASANRWLRGWKGDFWILRAAVTDSEDKGLMFALDISWSWATKFMQWAQENPEGGFWEGELSAQELTDLQSQNWMFVPEGIGYTVTKATAVDPVLELHKQND